MIENADKFYIGGQWVAPSFASTFAVLTPSTEVLFEEVAEAFEPDIARAVDAARRAFDLGPWGRLAPRERAGYVKAIGDLLMARHQEIARAWSNEMGIILPAAEGVSATRLRA